MAATKKTPHESRAKTPVPQETAFHRQFRIERKKEGHDIGDDTQLHRFPPDLHDIGLQCCRDERCRLYGGVMKETTPSRR